MKTITPEDVLLKNACTPGVNWLKSRKSYDYASVIPQALRSRPIERLWFFKNMLTYEQLKEYADYLKELAEYLKAFAPDDEKAKAKISFDSTFVNHGTIHKNSDQKELAKITIKVSDSLRKAAKEHNIVLDPFLTTKLLEIIGD